MSLSVFLCGVFGGAVLDISITTEAGDVITTEAGDPITPE